MDTPSSYGVIFGPDIVMTRCDAVRYPGRVKYTDDQQIY